MYRSAITELNDVEEVFGANFLMEVYVCVLINFNRFWSKTDRYNQIDEAEPWSFNKITFWPQQIDNACMGINFFYSFDYLDGFVSITKKKRDKSSIRLYCDGKYMISIELVITDGTLNCRCTETSCNCWQNRCTTTIRIELFFVMCIKAYLHMERSSNKFERTNKRRKKSIQVGSCALSISSNLG